jgi:hypothetical protein
MVEEELQRLKAWFGAITGQDQEAHLDGRSGLRLSRDGQDEYEHHHE